jgi:hypothetical protein
MRRRRDANEETAYGDGDEKLLPAPPRSELEGLSVTEIMDEYEVARTTSTRWLAARGLYEPERSTAGTSELGRKLLEMDPDELGGETV